MHFDLYLHLFIQCCLRSLINKCFDDVFVVLSRRLTNLASSFEFNLWNPFSTCVVSPLLHKEHGFVYLHHWTAIIPFWCLDEANTHSHIPIPTIFSHSNIQQFGEVFLKTSEIFQWEILKSPSLPTPITVLQFCLVPLSWLCYGVHDLILVKGRGWSKPRFHSLSCEYLGYWAVQSYSKNIRQTRS